jgi:hypothetical protein
MKTVAAAITIGVLAALLTACIVVDAPRGPTYRLDYLFSPPVTAEGRRCAAACENTKTYCQTAAHKDGAKQHHSCERQAANEYDNCVGRTTSFSEKQACYRKTCPVSPDYVNCESTFRSCFEGCGGQVWSRTVCDTNC